MFLRNWRRCTVLGLLTLAALGGLPYLLTPWSPRPLFFKGPVADDLLPIRRWIPTPPHVDANGTMTWFDEELDIVVVIDRPKARVIHEGDATVTIFDGGPEFAPDHATFASGGATVKVTASDAGYIIVVAGERSCRVHAPSGYARGLRDRLAKSDGTCLQTILEDDRLSTSERAVLGGMPR